MTTPYEKWLLSAAGRNQREYEFELTKKNRGLDAALKGDALYEREVFSAKANRLTEDAMAEFRRNGFEGDF